MGIGSLSTGLIDAVIDARPRPVALRILASRYYFHSPLRAWT
jgi:hypothetical protein